jgi:hypothetical protein
MHTQILTTHDILNRIDDESDEDSDSKGDVSSTVDHTKQGSQRDSAIIRNSSEVDRMIQDFSLQGLFHF